MKVELLSSIQWDMQHRDAGEVLDISNNDAHWLISRGRAKPYAEPEYPVENRSVALETSDAPKVYKRTYKKKSASSLS